MKRYFHCIFIVLFLLALYTPAAKMLLSTPDTWSENEKRVLATAPVLPQSILGLADFFRQSEKYLLDHFGYREHFIGRYYREIEKRFGITGMESKVLLGNDGWYYFTATRQMEDYQGHIPLSTSRLAEWVAERNQRYQWLRERGIEYLLIIPPGKHTIYPEYLPDGLRQNKGHSRLDQLLEFHQKQPLPYLVDLKQPLLAAKSEARIYHRSDTHWNLRGGYVAFKTIINTLQKRFPGSSFTTDFTFGPDTTQSCAATPAGCDLARMAMQHAKTTETYATIEEYVKCSRPRRFDKYQFTNLPEMPSGRSFAIGCNDKDLTALVFRDSFFVAVKPFILENFSHAVYLWKGYDQANIEEALKFYTPDVVIEMVVERNAFN